MYTNAVPNSKNPMFLFRMHSIGSVRPVPRASAVANQWWGGGKPLQEPMKQPEVEPTQNQEEPTPSSSSSSKELEEDVVVIQEEEMVLVRKEQQPRQEEQPHQEEQEEQPHQEQQPQQPQQEPQPQCMEPESTVVEPPSKSKYKKKQQKRK